MGQLFGGGVGGRGGGLGKKIKENSGDGGRGRANDRELPAKESSGGVGWKRER